MKKFYNKKDRVELIKKVERKTLINKLKLKAWKMIKIIGWVSVKEAIPKKDTEFWCKITYDGQEGFYEKATKGTIEMNEEGSEIMITHWFKFPFIWY